MFFVLITSIGPRGHVSPQLGPVSVLSGASVGSYGWARIQLLCIVKGRCIPEGWRDLGPWSGQMCQVCSEEMWRK